MLLRLEHVQKTYDTFALDVSIQIEEGKISGLIGANGAGKSTTIKAILGLIQTDSGTIERFGKQGKMISVSEKQKIGTVLSENTFSMMLNVTQIANILNNVYPHFEKEIFLRKCEAYKLPLTQELKEFSTGMKAKLKLLSALCHNASLLLLDEPTVGLDAITRNELLNELRAYMKDDKGILISSHISSDLEGLCDDLYFMKDGKIVLHEDTDLLLSSYGILKVSKEQYRNLDRKYILAEQQDVYSTILLTNERQFYLDNYRDIVVEKSSIDDVMLLLLK